MKTIAYLVILGVALYCGSKLLSDSHDFVKELKSNRVNQLMIMDN